MLSNEGYLITSNPSQIELFSSSNVTVTREDVRLGKIQKDRLAVLSSPLCVSCLCRI